MLHQSGNTATITAARLPQQLSPLPHGRRRLGLVPKQKPKPDRPIQKKNPAKLNPSSVNLRPRKIESVPGAGSNASKITIEPTDQFKPISSDQLNP